MKTSHLAKVPHATKVENQLTTKTPKNQTMPKPSRPKLLQSANDLVDASFSNTKDIEVDDMNDKMQQVTMATPPRNTHHGGRGFTKQALAAVEYLKHLGMYVVHDPCHSNPPGIEGLRLGPRCNDDGTERYSSIHLRL